MCVRDCVWRGGRGALSPLCSHVLCSSSPGKLFKTHASCNLAQRMYAHTLSTLQPSPKLNLSLRSVPHSSRHFLISLWSAPTQTSEVQATPGNDVSTCVKALSQTTDLRCSLATGF